ncbi:uncharacterized protein MONBRDRAFT_27108 [Monosiga brevicollis MX1]|uniref:Photolyase/cryptochrome alpha/beta domain-containing protein n=1 Tax=Monosiga brevicollis TaxID=81824 RepID=A9V4B6_MONBE|nr:uncharacterized protein MONBRDRAFT_27108 [Monosiga brevicollis MX1]EDQ87586.1 predicted protein [Monosiga brevicollis MX1]|eukprot:XP_001747506.1 hypothetical protein [Monosiga brevicollis MX1]
MSSSSISLHWFRKGQRLHDNPALWRALRGATQVYPVFVIDPHFAKPENVGVLRYNFLLESLKDLDEQLRGLGSRLYVLRGKPEEQLPKKFKEWKVTRLTYELDTEPYARVRDAAINDLAKKHNVEVIAEAGHMLHDPESYLKKCGGASKDRQDKSYDVPTLKEMGYSPIKAPQMVLFPGGEREALKRLEHFIKKKNWIATFEKPKTNPAALDPDTTGLSPYMKMGCLSVRKFWYDVQKVYDEKKDHSTPPESLHGQLLFRELFHLCGYAVKNFDKMKGNRICRQIDWDYSEKFLDAWENSKTGYPWIDACMAQLRHEGWMHHLARHAVACFLTRGDLYQSWEHGARIFEKHLVDADWHLNNANWMWLSCSSFFYQYFRVYSPIGFGQKYDKEGAFIRKYLPVLKDMPKKYIYEPWKAPKEVQQKAKCIIGKDYPEPIVDHSDVSETNKDRMKACYDAHKRGGPIPGSVSRGATTDGAPTQKRPKHE